MRRGERTPEAVKAYRKRQRRIRRYMELREELQLSGDIPVEPDGATFTRARPNGDERVDPATQTEQALPAIITQAIRQGWAVPEEKKPVLVDEMIGIIDDPEEANKVKVAAFNALRQADQHQYERDHPENAKLTGTTVLNVVEVVVTNDSSKQASEIVTEAATVSAE